MTDKENAINNLRGVMYALPMFGLIFLAGPITVAKGIYAKDFGLDLTIIALAVVWARLFDAVTDPLLGYWSDRCQTRWGSRKPMIVFGGLLFVASCYLFYVPVVTETSDGDKTVSAGYFVSCYMLFILAKTIVEIPHLAWGSDLTRDNNQRRMLFGWRAFFTYFAQVLFYLVPFLPLFDSRAFTPATLEWTVLIGGVLMVLCLGCGLRVPNGEVIQVPRKPAVAGGKNSLYQVVVALASNIPLRFLLGAVALIYTGVGMWLALLFLFVDVYLGLGEVFAGAYALAFAVSAVATYGWARLARYLGDQRTWVVALALGITGAGLTSLLVPGQSPLWLLAACMVMFMVGYSCLHVVGPTILSAIVDYDTWKSGGQRAGTFFSFYAFLLKVGAACGAALGYFIAEIYGFDATAATHPAGTVIGLRLGMTWLPAVFMGLAIFCVVLNPLNAHRHAIIRRRLDSVAKRHQRREKTSPDGHKNIFAAEIKPVG